MQTVTVSASIQYDVIIGSGARKLLAEKIKARFGTPRVCVVSDDRVAALHLAALKDDLRQAGVDCVSYVFPHGEQSKTPETLFDLLAFLAQARLSRKDVLVALGGGVTGDMCGFAAATYLRGIPFVQIPTTVLAQNDSSVGGKTGVD
ncbi:MAG: iron-containing alcohol dehydrogenase, partial [Clostridia bacterium]|nr:iron-containing alcohol dehydrogenase [Clostridia bacterium]